MDTTALTSTNETRPQSLFCSILFRKMENLKHNNYASFEVLPTTIVLIALPPKVFFIKANNQSDTRGVCSEDIFFNVALPFHCWSVKLEGLWAERAKKWNVSPFSDYYEYTYVYSRTEPQTKDCLDHKMENIPHMACSHQWHIVTELTFQVDTSRYILSFYEISKIYLNNYIELNIIWLRLIC